MDPVQAANVALTVWQVLSAAAGGEQATPGTTNGQPAPSLSPPDVSAHAFAEMQERLDRLVLVVQALWTLVAEKGGVSEADLLKRMTELDAADGTVDGHVTAPPVKCACGAMVCRKLARCLFCGKPYGASSAFETL